MQSCQGVMLVFSITSRHSFESLAAYQNEVPRIKQVERIPMVVVGNKCDLEADRQATAEEGEEYARRLNAPYLETSARTGVNLEDAFLRLVKEVQTWPVREPKAGTKSSGKDMQKCCVS